MNRIIKPIMMIIFLGSGCYDAKKTSIGNEDEITVIADSAEWGKFRPLLEQVFEKEIFTPQREKLLKLRWFPPGKFPKKIRQKNLLIISTLSNQGKTTQLIKDILDNSIIDKMRNNEIYVITENDHFARDQKLMILASWDEPGLKKHITDNSLFLYDIFDQVVNRRAAARVLGKRSRNRLSNRIMEKHGFSFKIPLDYSIILDDPDRRILWLASHGTRRWFLVYWEEVEDIPVLDTEWVINKRNELGITLFDSVRVNENYLVEDRILINEWVVLKVSGLYEKINEQLGGPFVSFLFYDEKSSRLYFLDGAVFTPGEDKIKFLRTLELMARSFITSNGNG